MLSGSPLFFAASSCACFSFSALTAASNFSWVGTLLIGYLIEVSGAWKTGNARPRTTGTSVDFTTGGSIVGIILGP